MNPFRVLSSILVHLSSILLKNFGLVILPICPFPTIDCTFPKVDYELVTLVAYIYRVDTQGDGERDSSSYLGQKLFKLTRAPWRVDP